MGFKEHYEESQLNEADNKTLDLDKTKKIGEVKFRKTIKPAEKARKALAASLYEQYIGLAISSWADSEPEEKTLKDLNDYINNYMKDFWDLYNEEMEYTQDYVEEMIQDLVKKNKGKIKI